ncbi:MAG: gamma-butyrobetaine hydroxylase-like domain-containing protein [Gammaproteobacteria bacterium]
MKHHPTEIKIRKASKLLEVAFDEERFVMPFEYLRVFSPSAEVRGHGPGQEVLQVGKQDVNITRIEPTGSYGVRLVFSDGHNSGIYSWDVLYDLGENQDNNWNSYIEQLEQAGQSRTEAS